MKLGRNFDLMEFCTSQTAARHGIPMDPPPHVVNNLRALVMNVLDPLRDALRRPIVISSGYRPSALNVLVKGSNRSQHVTGQAADIVVPGMRPIVVCEMIRDSGLPFDQLIHEFGSWTHVSYSTTRRRGSVITATRAGRDVIYSQGLV